MYIFPRSPTSPIAIWDAVFQKLAEVAEIC